MLQQNMIRNKKMTIALLLIYIAVHIVYIKLILRLFDIPMYLSVTLQTVSYIVLGSVGAFLFSNKIRDGIELWKEYPIKNVLFFFGAFVLDTLLSNLACIPIMLLNPNYESINEHSVAELQGKFPVLLLIISLGIMGPLTEEVVFRLIPAFFTEKKVSRTIGVIATSIIFMFIHVNGFTLEEFLYNLPMLVTGIIYGVATIISRNATIPILLHIMNNLPAIIMLLLFK